MIIENMKIYLSGPVTGFDDYRENFRKAEIIIKDIFRCDVFNPVEHIREVFKNPDEIGWTFIMKVLLEELLYGGYTHICMLPEWEKSNGAKIENIYALKNGIMSFTFEEITGCSSLSKSR